MTLTNVFCQQRLEADVLLERKLQDWYWGHNPRYLPSCSHQRSSTWTGLSPKGGSEGINRQNRAPCPQSWCWSNKNVDNEATLDRSQAGPGKQLCPSGCSKGPQRPRGSLPTEPSWARGVGVLSSWTRRLGYCSPSSGAFLLSWRVGPHLFKLPHKGPDQSWGPWLCSPTGPWASLL